MKKRLTQFLAEMNYGSLIDEDKYHKLDHADQTLYKYTADGFTSIDGSLDTLIERYPYDGGTLYRGFHFDNQKQHDQLLKDIEDGSVDFKGPSSWTTHLNTAIGFAKSKKSYFPTLELMKAERDMNDRGDHMTGYGGIVMETKVGKNIGCDVRKSSFSKEDEVILPDGHYKIKLKELIEPFHRKYDTPEKVVDIISQLKKAKETNSNLDKLVDFVRRSWINKLTPEQVDVVINYTNKKAFSIPAATLAERAISCDFRKRVFETDGSLRLEVYAKVPFDFILYKKSTEAMQKKIDKLILVMVKALGKELKKIEDAKNFDKIEEFDIGGVDALRQFMPSETDEIIQPLRRMLGDKYHQLNSRETNKTLKNTDDFSKHAKKIGAVITAMSKL